MRINAVEKKYNHQEVLKGIDLMVTSGERIVVMGPSGSGKTTLLRLIAGLERPDSGEIHMFDKIVSQPGKVMSPYKRQIGMVFQNATLWPFMSVEKNILFPMHKNEIKTQQNHIGALLDHLDIRRLLHTRPSDLSGGEAKRVAIARALVSNPKILLLDEPLTHLDRHSKEKITEAIDAFIIKNKSTLIYVTHDESEAKQLANSKYIIEDGFLIHENDI
ncbi:ATP-binding cassette domain-containing protein [Petrocella sp. FN5]|uniref:ATP-binding cassette domain-containing protein n=1 Tax=Petrocella sp. FN5 TaxID=3032002 RepID=UPI0023DB62E2|nr:ATP-binding cassette domain-containing protein [Petrocella sp. FN5]MDF1617795.1 ATP-binding cassette domain-containing protein [Petrocella sp. FN5]